MTAQTGNSRPAIPSDQQAFINYIAKDEKFVAKLRGARIPEFTGYDAIMYMGLQPEEASISYAIYALEDVNVWIQTECFVKKIGVLVSYQKMNYTPNSQIEKEFTYANYTNKTTFAVVVTNDLLGVSSVYD